MSDRCLEYKEWTHAVYTEYGIPEMFFDGLDRYLKQRIEPGGFLFAVLTNDLRGAMLRWAGPADANPAHRLIQFLNAECPAPCHGTPEQVAAWLAEGRSRFRQDDGGVREEYRAREN